MCKSHKLNGSISKVKETTSEVKQDSRRLFYDRMRSSIEKSSGSPYLEGSLLSIYFLNVIYKVER